MRIAHFILTVALLSGTAVAAEVRLETLCYVRVPPGKDSKPIRMVFRSYYDQELKKEIGSFVQYNESKEIIPLMFEKFVNTDADSPELGNYEISRIEIINKKIAGEYTFVQTGAGHLQGRYVKYTNAKTGKSVTFQHTGDDDSACKVNR